jgi:GMP synthase-like glutamine amidotransferase
MKLCILENDDLDPTVVSVYKGYGAMTERLLRDAGASDWTIQVFHTPSGQYPASFESYDAVLLTGSKADAFSQEPWVADLRRIVTVLLEEGKKLIGICFGHQLIALCLGAKVGRAPQGWGVGRMSYDWHAAELPLSPQDGRLSLLVSHQDQVLELPENAVLLASNAHCPVAGYAIGDQVFCVQGHPEFVAPYSAFLLNKRRDSLGETLYQQGMSSLEHAHDGLRVARMMIAFVERIPAPV